MKSRIAQLSAAVAASVALLIGGTALPASAAGESTIAGTVLDGYQGPALAGVTARLWQDTGSGFAPTGASQVTNSAGAYSFTGLDAGDYRVLLDGTAIGYYSIWALGNTYYTSQAETIELGAAHYWDLSGAYIGQGASVSGTIEELDGSSPDGTVAVALVTSRYEPDTQETIWETPIVNGNGDNDSFTRQYLPPGQYKIEITDGDAGDGIDYVSEYWDDRPSRDYADAVNLVAGQSRTDIDITVARTSDLRTLSGQLTLAGGGTLGRVEVVAQEQEGGQWVTRGAAFSETDGSFSMEVEPGTYRLTYWAYGSETVAEFWGEEDAYFEDQAVLLTVGANDVPDLDRELELGTTFEVSWTNATVEYPEADLNWQYERSPGVWETLPNVFGAGDISFARFGYLPAGTYRFSWTDGNADDAYDWDDQWFDNRPTLESADLIEVAYGTELVEIDQVLSLDEDLALTAPTPTIAGVAEAGETLTATVGAWAPADTTLWYEWRLDGEPIEGETGTTLEVTEALEGGEITFAVTGDRPGYAAQTVESAPADVPVPFTDVPDDHAFATEIAWMFRAGISSGNLEPDGTITYRPMENVTRQAMAAFLYRLAGSPEFTPPTTPSFTDVPTIAAFYTPIEWLKAEGIANGNADGTFGPTDDISRQAVAAFLYRYAGSPAFTPSGESFTDMPSSAPFYLEIEWMKANGITNGNLNGDGTLSYLPIDPLTRQAMAAFLYRLTHPATAT